MLERLSEKQLEPKDNKFDNFGDKRQDNYNLSLPAEESVALHRLVLVHGNEGEHVGE